MNSDIYRAKVVKYGDNGEVFIQCPQKYLDTVVELADYMGEIPALDSMGYIGFISGDVSYPVWIGTGNLL